MRKRNFEEIVNTVRATFPQDEWAKEIKTRIKEASPEIVKPEPENKKIVIDDFTRATADRICSAHFSGEKNEDKVLLTYFVRGASKLESVKVCVKTGAVYNKMNKGNIAGVLVAFKHADQIRIGWSLYNKNHEVLPFTKKDGLRVAVIRGLVDSVVVDSKPSSFSQKWMTGSEVLIPAKIFKALPDFTERARKYFARAISNLEHI
jgi:hypothetical protein